MPSRWSKKHSPGFQRGQGNGRNSIIWVAPTCTGKLQTEFQCLKHPPYMGILNKKTANSGGFQVIDQGLEP